VHPRREKKDEKTTKSEKKLQGGTRRERKKSPGGKGSLVHLSKINDTPSPGEREGKKQCVSPLQGVLFLLHWKTVSRTMGEKGSGDKLCGGGQTLLSLLQKQEQSMQKDSTTD